MSELYNRAWTYTGLSNLSRHFVSSNSLPHFTAKTTKYLLSSVKYPNPSERSFLGKNLWPPLLIIFHHPTLDPRPQNSSTFLCRPRALNTVINNGTDEGRPRPKFCFDFKVRVIYYKINSSRPWPLVYHILNDSAVTLTV